MTKNTQPVIPSWKDQVDALNKQIKLLELEAIWLAHKVACYYQIIDNRCNDEKIKECNNDAAENCLINFEYWRKQAKKAVEDISWRTV